MFKFISEDSVLLTYGKWHENDKLTFFFNKELEQVDIEYQIFERNADLALNEIEGRILAQAEAIKRGWDYTIFAKPVEKGGE